MSCRNLVYRDLISFEGDLWPAEMTERGQPGDRAGIRDIPLVIEDPEIEADAPNLLFGNDTKGFHVQATGFFETSFQESVDLYALLFLSAAPAICETRRRHGAEVNLDFERALVGFGGRGFHEAARDAGQDLSLAQGDMGRAPLGAEAQLEIPSVGQLSLIHI